MEQVLSMNNKPKPDEHEYRRPFTTREEPAHQAYDSLYQSNKQQQQHPSGTLIYDHNRVVGEAVTQQQPQPHVVNEYEVSKVEEKVEETFNLIEESHIVENEFDKVEPREPVHLINIINEATKINTNKINTSPTPSPSPIKLTTNKLTILTETPTTTTSSKPSKETPPQFSFVDFIDFKSIPVYPYPNENDDDDLLLKAQLEREQKDKLKQEQQQQKEKQEAYEREQREKAAELLIQQQQQQQQERKDREQQQQKQREKEQQEQLLKQKLRLDQQQQPKPEEALLGKRKPFFL
jgi:hypothetical protein